MAKAFFALTRRLRRDQHLLVCRLVRQKVTFVHENLWAALVRAQRDFPRKWLEEIHEVHTPSGWHAVRTIPIDEWASAGLKERAARISLSAARELLIRHGIKMSRPPRRRVSLK